MLIHSDSALDPLAGQLEERVFCHRRLRPGNSPGWWVSHLVTKTSNAFVREMVL